MMPLYEQWNKYLEELVDPKSVDLSSFEMHDQLSPSIWSPQRHLLPLIRERLLEIVQDFFESLGDSKVNISDVTFTGSLANYNWSRFSDIDLHLIIDFSEMDANTKLVKQWLDEVRINWNRTHKIEIAGHEVEIYIQDKYEPHISSGVYSVLNDDWIVTPSLQNPTVKWEEVQEKAANIMDDIDGIEEMMGTDLETALQYADATREKLKNFRKSGLDRGGEFSLENLSFKALRRNGYLEKLSKIKTDSYDQSMSLDEEDAPLFEAAKSPEELPATWHIQVKKKPGQYNISLLQANNKEVPGSAIRRSGVTISMSNLKKCGLLSWEVVHSSAPKGWGPLLYDIAMEIADSAGIFSDRASVSEQAQAIWDFYAHNREGEIENFHPLELFDIEEEDCVETVNQLFGDEYDFSASNRIYRRADGRTPVLDKMNKMGKIKFV